MQSSNSHKKRKRSSIGSEGQWGKFTINDERVRQFRSALEADLGRAVAESDDEIRQMAYDLIELLDALARFAERRRAEGRAGLPIVTQ